VLADLKERRISRGLNEIAFRIKLEQARALLADLPGKDIARSKRVAGGR
jgi:hypothetical protein